MVRAFADASTVSFGVRVVSESQVTRSTGLPELSVVTLSVQMETLVPDHLPLLYDWHVRR